jgi:hypothetical protein
MKGHFKKGRDRRRHKLTTKERRKGFATTFQKAMYEKPEWLLWLRNKIRAARRKS